MPMGTPADDGISVTYKGSIGGQAIITQFLYVNNPNLVSANTGYLWARPFGIWSGLFTSPLTVAYLAAFPAAYQLQTILVRSFGGTAGQLWERTPAAPLFGTNGSTDAYLPINCAPSYRSGQPAAGVRRAMHRIGVVREADADYGALSPAYQSGIGAALCAAMGAVVTITTGGEDDFYQPAVVPRVLIGGVRSLPETENFVWGYAEEWSLAARMGTQNTRKQPLRS